MYIHTKYSYSFLMLILFMTQTYGQQVRFSRPMITVAKQQPAYMTMLNGKKLSAPVIQDIIRIDIHERLNGAGSFIIKLNNRDNMKPSLKFGKSNPFHLGDKIEILLVRDKNESSRRLAKGTVAFVNENNNKPDSSFLVIEGIAQRPYIRLHDDNESTTCKIDSSNCQLFIITKKMVKDQIEVSLADGNDITGLPD